ncbi:hypothetical protein [Paraburkholderia sediminicola]|uniref:hypothetical protein n=1 Tax=Paraburkholderia sediminicola TaxID=458836 RepID=UPI0038BA20E0
MNEPLNHKADLGTLACHAVYRELLATVSEDEAERLVGRLEIRVRGDGDDSPPLGRFRSAMMPKSRLNF